MAFYWTNETDYNGTTTRTIYFVAPISRSWWRRLVEWLKGGN